MDTPRTATPFRRRLGAVIALALVVVGLPVLYLLMRGETAGRSVAERIEACRQLQGDTDEQQEPVVVCLADALSDAVEDGTYPEVLGMAQELTTSRMNASCHAAGHRVGGRLYETYGAARALEMMFGASNRPIEYTCTTAVVHGIVGGSEAGGEDLATVAGYCLSLDAVDFRYTHECAHFYGHGVWREVGTISAKLTDTCDNLDGSKTGMAVEICVSGAIMQRYDLQTKHYDPFNEEAQDKSPPSRDELLGLCDALASSEQTYSGCMGAVGWLSAMRAQAQLDVARDDDPSYIEESVAIYAAELATCKGQKSCEGNFITHFRPAAYRNGIATKVCAIGRVEQQRCDDVIALRTGTGNATPMAPGSGG